MKKILYYLMNYLFFLIGILLIIYATYFVVIQSGNCPPYLGDYNNSILSKWFNIVYFDQKAHHDWCFQTKNMSCNLKGFSSCGTSNYKPGITYGTLGIMIIIFGFYFRRKHISKL